MKEVLVGGWPPPRWRHTTTILLSGGPCPGPIDLAAVESFDMAESDPVWTIVLTHGDCPCGFCAAVGAPYVDHLYEMRADDLYVFRGSKPRTFEVAHA